MSLVHWSHLSMKAYEYFALCDVCGAMIHDSPTSKRIHEHFHDKLEEVATHAGRGSTYPVGSDAGS